MIRADRDALLRRLTLRLGAPLELPTLDQHRWRTCPICGEAPPSETDLLPGFHPLALTGDGQLMCDGCHSPETWLLAALVELDSTDEWRRRALAAEAKLAAEGGRG